MNFLTYYKTLDDEHRCLFADNHYETLKYLPANNEVHHYEVFKGYTATDEGLASFKADFLKWSDEIRHNDVLDIVLFSWGMRERENVWNGQRRPIQQQHLDRWLIDPSRPAEREIFQGSALAPYS
jgi:hypothetical protein